MALIYAAPQHTLFPCDIEQKAGRGRVVFFLFPFAGEPAAALAFQRIGQHKGLPLLPQPQSARTNSQLENGFADAVPEAGNLAVDLLKQALSLMMGSLTALGNHANALFSQAAAALAYERIARGMVSFSGAFWPGFAQPKPQFGFLGPWISPIPAPLFFFAGFGFPGRQPLPCLPNPWGAFADALSIWASLWTPTAPPRKRASHGAAGPVTVTFGVPGFSWSLALG